MNARTGLFEATAAGEPAVILYAVFCGIALGVLYDAFRLLRILLGLRRSPPLPFGSPGGVLLCFLDVLYGILAGVVFSVFLYHRNDGVIRWYAVLGALVGGGAYLATLGQLTSRLAARLANGIRRLGSAVLRRLPKRKKKKEISDGKKAKATEKKDQLLYKNRNLRIFRLLRHHDLSDGVPDQRL